MIRLCLFETSLGHFADDTIHNNKKPKTVETIVDTELKQLNGLG